MGPTLAGLGWLADQGRRGAALSGRHRVGAESAFRCP